MVSGFKMSSGQAKLPCWYYLFLMLMTVTYGQQLPSGGGGLMPDLGDRFPKLSMDCLVEFAKYGKPLIEMASSNSSVKLNQEMLVKILQSPVGQSKFFIL